MNARRGIESLLRIGALRASLAAMPLMMLAWAAVISLHDWLDAPPAWIALAIAHT